MESHYIQVKVYYSEKDQIRISQEKRHVGRVQESSKHKASNCLLPMEPQTVLPLATMCDNMHEYCQLDKLLQALVPRAFTGVQLQRHH